MLKTKSFILGLILLSAVARPQEIKTHENAISLNFLQIKEQANYGLVFKGPGLGYAYSARWENEKRAMVYEGRFSFSTPITRDIIGASINLVPVRFDYLFKTGVEAKVCIGPYAIMDYNYELYPDLQSGYSYWFTNFSLGGAVKYSFKMNENQFNLHFHTTLLGLTSRQPVYDDPYFFDLSFGDIVQFVHQDMQFGSWGSYNQSEIEITWQPRSDSRLAYSYAFQYYGYYPEPAITMLNQTIKLIILPKKNK